MSNRPTKLARSTHAALETASWARARGRAVRGVEVESVEWSRAEVEDRARRLLHLLFGPRPGQGEGEE
jgi:hypothetical protein